MRFLLVLALALAGCSAPAEPASPRTIAIDATATLHLPPDTTAITLTFAATSPDLAIAHERVEASRAAFLAAVASYDARVETGWTHYAPHRTYAGAEDGQFRAAQTLVVHTTEPADVPAIIRLAQPGVSEVSVHHYVADLVQHRARLRRMAVEAAAAKASDLATGFGVHLGDVLVIEERGADTHAFGVGNFDNVVARVAADDEGAPPPGAVPLRTTLRVTYALDA